jgi:hypothetical protein
MRTNKVKIQAWRAKQRQEARDKELIEKARRRHYGTPHAFMEWGKKNAILRAIHKELEPMLATIRSAQDFLYYGAGKQRNALKQRQ